MQLVGISNEKVKYLVDNMIITVDLDIEARKVLKYFYTLPANNS